MTESIELKLEFTLEGQVEGLLFIAPGPVTTQQIASSLDRTIPEIEKTLGDLKKRYEKGGGLYLQVHKSKIQLTTKPGLSPVIEKFLGLQATSKLSRAGIETLAIVAYKQPVTRPKLDDIRGVNSDGVIKSLLSKGLIEEIGRAEGPGRPIIYGTTSDFLQYFGLASLDDLPALGINAENEAMEIQEKVFKD
jgi:segregation and condensation protein B